MQATVSYHASQSRTHCGMLRLRARSPEFNRQIVPFTGTTCRFRPVLCCRRFPTLNDLEPAQIWHRMCNSQNMHTINLSPLISSFACAAVPLWLFVSKFGKRQLKSDEVAAMRDHVCRNYSRL
jgi:hypothetical protein